MLKHYYPCEQAQSVFHIDYQKLYDLGFRAVIFDIDNTLVHHGDDSTPEVDQLFGQIHRIGLKTCLLSNNSEARVQRFLANIDSPYIALADKPQPCGYRKALTLCNVSKEEAVVIGDQIFTDILGANNCGIPSILVDFIRKDPHAKIGKKRMLEKMILKIYSKSKKFTHRIGDIFR